MAEKYFISIEADIKTRKIHTKLTCADHDRDSKIKSFNSISEAKKEAPSGECKKCFN